MGVDSLVCRPVRAEPPSAPSEDLVPCGPEVVRFPCPGSFLGPSDQTSTFVSGVSRVSPVPLLWVSGGSLPRPTLEHGLLSRLPGTRTRVHRRGRASGDEKAQHAYNRSNLLERQDVRVPPWRVGPKECLYS